MESVSISLQQRGKAMMGVYGYKTKKQLKESVGQRFQYVETSIFGPEYKGDGSYTVVGPDAYHDRRFYATVTVKDNHIVSVR